jgi:outer membrane cobalamin receptor
MSCTKRLFVGILPVVLLLFATLVFASPASAQNAATLEVAVFDPSEAAVADATAVLQGLSSPGDRRQGAGSGDGRYRFDVPPGRYRLIITHTFLRRLERELELGAGERRELRVTLQLEPLSEHVVVSAEAWPITTTAASEPVTIITREEIERRQAVQLAPLLATLPGFSLGRTGREGGVASLFLNGGDSNFTKVLVDGVAVNEPGGAVDYSNFTLDNVEKIEVVQGAQSALFGSDAMAGVVQMLTHRGATSAPQLTLLAEGGGFSTGRGAAQLSGLAGRFDYSAAAAYFSTQGQGPNNRFLNRTLSGNFGWGFAETNTLRLTLRNNTSDAGVAGQVLFVPPNLDQHNGLHNFSATLRWDFQTGSRWRHQLAATESYIRQLFVFAAPPVLPIRNQLNRAGFVQQSSYLFRQGAVTAGYQYEVENGWVNGPHFRRNNQAGFLEGRWQLVPRLTVNTGFRVEDNASFGTRVVPRAGAAFILRSGSDSWGATRLRFSFGLGIKEPSLIESFSTNPFFFGNPNLRPERSRTFSIGVEQRLASDRLLFTADYFDNRFHDLISFGAGTFFNTDLARARGLNLIIDARALRWLHLSGSYSYNDSRVLESPNAFDAAAIEGNRLLRRPVHSGNLMLNAVLARMNWNLAGYFSGQRTDSSFLAPGVTRNPGYARLDLAGSYALRPDMSLFGRIENLADKQYQEAVGYPALGRDFRVGMKFTFGGE